MNAWQFARLIYSIYRRGGPLPDLDWLESLGLLAVKIGQMHALRVDFVDRDKCLHLTQLYRRARPVPPTELQGLLDRLAPPGFATHFDRIEMAPLATASVGQVHRAWLKDGSPVVIKLVKREVREAFTRDVQAVRRLLTLATTFYPKLARVGDPEGILEDIETYTLSELDLRHEVAGHATLKLIAESLAPTYDLRRLAFATLHPEISNANVLVSEYLPGQTFDELLERQALSYDELLVLFYIHGLYTFVVGTFHGDIHPGNVMSSNGSIYFIDTGYVGHVSTRIRVGLHRFLRALSEYDYPTCTRALHGMSLTPLSSAAFANFERRFAELYRDFKGKAVRDVSLTRQMMQTIKLAVHQGMHFERSIFGIIRSFMYLDGMVLRCRPEAVLMDDIRRLFGDLDPLLAAAPDGP